MAHLEPSLLVIGIQVADSEKFAHHATGELPVGKMAVKIKHDLSVLINQNPTYFCLTLKKSCITHPTCLRGQNECLIPTD